MTAKTKIVATIGPASDSEAMVRKLILAGVNLFRLNFSHGSHEQHLLRLRRIRKVAKRLKRNVGIIQDLSGPKIRLGILSPDKILLKPGSTVRLFAGAESSAPDLLPVSYPRLARDLKKGDQILLGDGEIELRALGVDAGKVICRVIVGGQISSKKGVNFPSERLTVSTITAKDRADLSVGVKAGVDYVALSFVRKAADILALRRLIQNLGADIPIIAKIETISALRNIDEIVAATDAVMVARGDLGVEVPLEEIPAVQKNLIRKANLMAKPVITATQMLRSMVENNRPTRAEVTDVANAIYDGTDAVMLSEESAVGKYPVEAVETMTRIALESEQDFYNLRKIERSGSNTDTVPEAISASAVEMAEAMKVKAIVTPSRSGYTARLVSRFRPRPPILALSPDREVVKRLSLVWAVQAHYCPDLEKQRDLLDYASRLARKILKLKKGDLIAITAGLPIGKTPRTNLVKLEKIE